MLLLPEVHPRSIALLDYDGNLVTMEMGSGEVKTVAEGVESVVDLSGVSEAWEAWEMPLLIHPCYLLRRKGRVGGDRRRDGGGTMQGVSGDSGTEDCEISEDYSVWCPAMRLDPCPPSIHRLLTPGRGGGGARGDARPLSPVLSLNPGASCDPERVDLGLQPLLGTMVHASQIVCRPRVSNTPALPPCYELRTHLRPILHMVLRHFLIASQLQLLDSPPTHCTERQDEATAGSSSGSVNDNFVNPGGSAASGSDGWVGVAVAEASAEGYDGDTERKEDGGRGEPLGGSADAGRRAGDASGGDGGGGDGKGRRLVDGASDDGEEQAAAAGSGGEERHWHGTSSDAFEIAVAVLKRCREDAVLVEALPDTLELLLRACMEALNIAGERAKRGAVMLRDGGGNGGGNRGGGGGPSCCGAVSELELARAVMSDSVYLAQLAPECFHEVVARVARKAEPERYSLLFPLHLVGDAEKGEGSSVGDGVETSWAEAARSGGRGSSSSNRRGGREEVAVGPRWGRWLHPTHLFDECVSAGRLTTAAWYLPLVRDDVAYDAARRHAGPNGPLSEEERKQLMPAEMWAVTGREWPFGLSHALACVLLLASLSLNQHAFLPEVWLFARKREQSAPHHHNRGDRHDTPESMEEEEEAGFKGASYSPWWTRGQGAAIEAVKAKTLAETSVTAAEAAATAAVTDRARGHGRSSSSGGGGKLGRGTRAHKATPRSPVSEGSLVCGEGTHFGRTSRLRLQALRRPGRLGDADTAEGGGLGDVSRASPAAIGEGASSSAGEESQLPVPERSEAAPARLYHLPFTRDAASVVSRFMWTELNELRVKSVLKAFQSLACGPAAREAGLAPSSVLSTLSPARRSMVGSLRRLPAETMAGLMVALSEMFKVSVGLLALLAAPAGDSPTLPSNNAGDKVDSGVPPASPSTATARAAGQAAVDVGDGSGTTAKRSPSEDSGGPTAAQRRAQASLTASIRPQLELLGDLCQAVGHGEAALVCASLLRDETMATTTLGNASQTLRLGYGHFISDLLGSLRTARDAAPAAAQTREADGPVGEQTPAQTAPGVVPDAERRDSVGPAAVVAGMGVGAGAVALISLQRFGGKCVRGLTNAAFA